MTNWFGLVLAAFMVCTGPSAAQDWPTRPVRIVVPFGPGSTPDIIARLIAEPMTQRLGQPFTIDNKPGAGGNLGTDAVAKAEPDGATIGVSIGGPLAINTLLFAKLPYDPAKDIAPITQLVTQPSVLVVHASVEAKTAGELVQSLARDPSRYNYGSIGNGSLSHLAMEAIAQTSGGRPVHIPYASSPAAMTALLRGDVQLAVLPAIAVTPHIASGAIRILAVSTAQRSPFLPDVPTLRESGIDVEADAWNGLIAPARTAPMIVMRLQQEVAAILALPPIRQRLATQLMEPVGSTPADFRARIDGEIARWSPVIRKAGIRIE